MRLALRVFFFFKKIAAPEVRRQDVAGIEYCHRDHLFFIICGSV